MSIFESTVEETSSGGGAVMGYLGGLHFWWPKISGRKYPEGWGRLAAMIVFIGFNLTFFPQFILGYLGMPRRYWQYPPEFQVLNVLSTAGSTILAIGYLLPMVYFLLSVSRTLELYLTMPRLSFLAYSSFSWSLLIPVFCSTI